MSAARGTMQHGRCAPSQWNRRYPDFSLFLCFSVFLYVSLSLLSRVVARPGFIPVVVRLLLFFTEFHPSVFSFLFSFSLPFRAPIARLPFPHPFHSLARSLYFSPSNSHRSSARSSRRVCPRELTNSATDFYYGDIRPSLSLSISFSPLPSFSVPLEPHRLGYNRFEATAISDMRVPTNRQYSRDYTLFLSFPRAGSNKLASSPRRDFPE